MYSQVNLKSIGYYQQVNPITLDNNIDKAVQYNREKHGNNIHIFFPISNHSKYAYKVNKIDLHLATELRFGVIENEVGERYLVHSDQHYEDGDENKNLVDLYIKVYDQLCNKQIVNSELLKGLFLYRKNDFNNLLLNKGSEDIWSEIEKIIPELSYSLEERLRILM